MTTKMQCCYGHNPHNVTQPKNSPSSPPPTQSRASDSLEMKNSLRAVNSRLKANRNSKGRNKSSSHCHTLVSFRLFCRLTLRILLQSLFALPLHTQLSLSVFPFSIHSSGYREFTFFSSLSNSLPCSTFSIPLFSTGQSMELKGSLE